MLYGDWCPSTSTAQTIQVLSPSPSPPVENDTFITPVTLIMQKKNSILCNYSCCTLGWGWGLPILVWWVGSGGVLVAHWNRRTPITNTLCGPCDACCNIVVLYIIVLLTSLVIGSRLPTEILVVPVLSTSCQESAQGNLP